MLLPESFLKRMKSLLKDEFDDFLAAMNEEPVKAFRVNTDKIHLSDFKKINIFGNEKIPYTENGFYLEYDKAGNHPYHHAGMIYIQEPSAMAPAECVDVKPDWKILDMCAAPGGKSTQLKNKLSDEGVLVSNEIIYNRCKILAGNIERLGLKNCAVTCKDTNSLSKIFLNTFDMVMVDAPCSGEGMFRKDSTAISEWSEANVVRCAIRQKEILSNAALCLKDGGYIVYSTCTYSLNENEMVIDDFLQNNSEFELVPTNEKVIKYSSDGIKFDGCKTENIHYCRRFYPHKNRGEGQFVAVLKNKRQKCDTISNKKTSKCNNTVFDFLDNTLTDYKKENVIEKDNTYNYFTPDFEIKCDSAFLLGVKLGENKKNYFQPHHQFFMALGDKFKNKIELSSDSEEIKKYLHGEEFYCNAPNGWAAILVDGCSVGGVKVTNSIAKNHYPKGLRTLY